MDPQEAKLRAYDAFLSKAMRSSNVEEVDSFLLAHSVFLPKGADPLVLWLKHFGTFCLSEKDRNKIHTKERMVRFVIALSHQQSMGPQIRKRILDIVCKEVPSMANTFKLHLLRDNKIKTDRREMRKRNGSMIYEGSPMLSAKGITSSNGSGNVPTSKLFSHRRKLSQGSINILNIDTNNLARELTVREFDLFRRIEGWDVIAYQRGKEDASGSPLSELIRQFNAVSKWVATQILILKHRRDQARAIKRFVRVGRRCLALNNFNALMEVLSGLNHSSVQRLKRVWEILPAQSLTHFKRLEQIMAPNHNFKRYRRILKSAKLPVLPYVGIYLRDLTFILDGNEWFTSDNRVNPQLVELVRERFSELREYQVTAYSFMNIANGTLADTSNTAPSWERDDALKAYFENLPYVEDEDELHALSLITQPSLWVDPQMRQRTGTEQTSSCSDQDLSDNSSLSNLLTDSSKTDTATYGDSGFSGSDSQIGITLPEPDESSATEDDTSDRTSGADEDSATSSGTRSVRKSPAPSTDTTPRAEANIIVRGDGGNGDVSLQRKARMAASVQAEDEKRKSSGSKIRTVKDKRKRNRNRSSLVARKTLLSKVEEDGTDKAGCQCVVPIPGMGYNFLQAETKIKSYFEQCHKSTKTGTIMMSNDRFLMLRSSSISVEFFSSIAHHVQSLEAGSAGTRFCYQLLFDLGHSVARSDFKSIAAVAKGHLMEAFAAGPVYMAYTGAASVKFEEEGCLAADESFYLPYSQPFSFEAQSWIRKRETLEREAASSSGNRDSKTMRKNSRASAIAAKPTQPVCIISAGFFSGWASECLGVPLVSVEVTCRALGDDCCRFVMAHPKNIKAKVEKLCDSLNLGQEIKDRALYLEFMSSKNAAHFVPETVRDSADSMPTQASLKDAELGELKKLNEKQNQKNHNIVQEVLKNRTSYDKKMRRALGAQVCDPRQAVVKVNDERYYFIRASTLSTDFFGLMAHTFGEGQQEEARLFTTNLLFDIAKSLGHSDGPFFGREFFGPQITVDSYLHRIYSMPTIASHKGFCKMRLNLEGEDVCALEKSENFYFTFNVSNSFEATAWMAHDAQEFEEESDTEEDDFEEDIRQLTASSKKMVSVASRIRPVKRKHTHKHPVCVMTAGYSMGYLNGCVKKHDSTKPKIAGIGVVEVSCQGRGDAECIFVAASVQNLELRVRNWLHNHHAEKGTENVNIEAELALLHLSLATRGKKAKHRKGRLAFPTSRG